jgi:hypothetical protein
MGSWGLAPVPVAQLAERSVATVVSRDACVQVDDTEMERSRFESWRGHGAG